MLGWVRRAASGRSQRLVASVLLGGILLVACGGNEASSSPTEAGPTVRPQPTRPPSTPLPPPSSGNPFRGSAQIDDAAGDVDGPGEVPAGIDLIGARVIASENQLVFIWFTATRAATSVEDGDTASWKVELSNGDAPAYDVTFQVSGREWDILILDRETGEETKHRIGSIYNDRLDVPYPASKLDKLQPTFSWSASSRYVDASGMTWVDLVPDDGGKVPYPN